GPGSVAPANLEARELGNAKERIKTEIEIEDPPRRQEALQDHRQRQDQAHALRQAPLDGHQSARAHAQAEEADTSESSGCGQRAADAALRLNGVLPTGSARR